MMDDSSILELFNLEPQDVQSIQCTRQKDALILEVTLTDTRPPCPDCGCSNVKIKGYILKKINHSALNDRKCIIRYHARRYSCPVCHRTYYEHNPFVFKQMKISALTVINILDDLKKPSETFTSVARRHNISPVSVASIFDKYVKMSRKKLPRILSIDENYAFHSLDLKSKYVCILIDQTNGTPVDMLPSRRYDYLCRYLAGIPLQERNTVKAICTDMYDTYRTVIKMYFKKTMHCVDRFHVAQELNRQVNRARIRIMKSYAAVNVKNRTKKQEDAYYLLKHFNWLLFKHYQKARTKDKVRIFDPDRERVYNKHFHRHMNYYELSLQLRSIHPDLETVWALKDGMIDFYEETTLDEANKKLNEQIQRFEKSGIEEMEHFAKTLINWRTEIINSFRISHRNYYINYQNGSFVEEDKKISNALMENRNAIIKLLKKSANGYKNWDRFRNRCMYILTEDVHFTSNEKLEIQMKRRE